MPPLRESLGCSNITLRQSIDQCKQSVPRDGGIEISFPNHFITSDC